MKKWEIIHSIRKTYLCGNIDKDECLPTIRELAGKFAVSRETVRKAINEMKEIGEIRTIPGAGIFSIGVKIAKKDKASSFSPFMIGLNSANIPVVRCLVIDHRPNKHLKQAVAKFNQTESRFNIALETTDSVDLSYPKYSYDLIMGSSHIIHAWSQAMEFWDLRKLTQSCLEITKKIFPSALKSCLGPQNQLYALPYFFSIYLLFVRKDFFKSNIKFANWELFFELCKKHKTDEKQTMLLPRVFSLFFSAGLWSVFSDQNMDFKPDLIKKLLLKIKESLEVLDLENKREREDLIPDFINGKIPFLDLFSGDLNRFIKQKKTKICATKILLGNGNVLGSSGIGAIPKESLHPEQAMKFLLFLLKKENQKILAKNGEDLPARADCLQFTFPDNVSRELYEQVYTLSMESQNMCSFNQPQASPFFFNEIAPELNLYFKGVVNLNETLNKIKSITERFKSNSIIQKYA